MIYLRKEILWCLNMDMVMVFGNLIKNIMYNYENELDGIMVIVYDVKLDDIQDGFIGLD